MYKELLNILAELRSGLTEMEMELKYVRDVAGPGLPRHGEADAGTGECVKNALRQLDVFRESLWKVDKALEAERGGIGKKK